MAVDLFLELGIELVVQLACVDEQGLSDLLHLTLQGFRLGRERERERETMKERERECK